MDNLIRSCFILLLLLSGCGWDGTPTRHNDFVPLTSIKISAFYSTIAAQTSTRFTATGDYSGLYTRDITDQVVWSSDSTLVASFPYSTAPNKNQVVGGLAPGGIAIITAKVGSVSADFTLKVSSATITNPLTITPDAPSIAKGLSRQFLVSGTFSDATVQNLTEDVNWSSSATDVATVSDEVVSKGLVKALAVGKSTITATFKDASGSTPLTVTEPVLQSIELSPNNPSILTLSTKKITATGTYSDGSTPDISSQVTWGSSNPAIATIKVDGTVTILTQGTTTISATSPDGKISKSMTLKATGGNLTQFTVSPSIVTLVKDNTRRIIATGTFSNGSIRDITGAVQWTAANTSIASVTADGGNLVWLNALAVTPTTVITATSGTLIPSPATLTITAPQLLSIAIITASPELTAGTLTAGTSARFTATATFDDGTTQDVTALSVWTSKDATTATVGTSGLAAGRVTGVATGSTTVSATYTNNGKTVSVLGPNTVAVKSRSLQSLTISPATSSVIAGNQVTFTAMASYSDGTTKDVTEDAVWSIDNSNVAILADNLNQPGQVVAVDRGSTTITAIFEGKTQAATITVTGP